MQSGSPSDPGPRPPAGARPRGDPAVLRPEPSRLPRRGLAATALTAGGLALLLGFRPSHSGGSLVAALASEPTTTSGASVMPSASNGPAVPVTSPSPGASATASAEPSATPATLVLTGDAVDVGYGLVQVQVTVQDGAITDVVALQLPSGDRHSDRINAAAEPILREEALTAQSAAIDLVSGATYTSMGYAMSLQSALDGLADPAA